MHGHFSLGANVEVSSTSLLQKGLENGSYVLSIHKDFEFKVKNSSKAFFTFKYVGEICKWSLHAEAVKVVIYSRSQDYLDMHPCSIGILNHDHRQASAMFIGQIIKDKCTSVGHVYKPCQLLRI